MLKISEEIWHVVSDFLCEDWSPEQIGGWLAANRNLLVSHERTYQHVADDKRQGGASHPPKEKKKEL